MNIKHELTKLRSPNVGDRKNAAWVLGDTGDRRVVAPLVQVLKNEPDKFVRINIVKALAKISDKRALPILKNLKNSDKEVKVRKEASYAIRKIKTSIQKSPEVKASRTIMKAPTKHPTIRRKTPTNLQPKRKSVSMPERKPKKVSQQSKKLTATNNRKKVPTKKLQKISSPQKNKPIPKLPSKTKTDSTRKKRVKSTQKPSPVQQKQRIKTTKSVSKIKPKKVVRPATKSTISKPKPVKKDKKKRKD